MKTSTLLLALTTVAAAKHHFDAFPNFKHNSPMIKRLKARQLGQTQQVPGPAVDSKHVPGYIDQFLAAIGPARVTTFLPPVCGKDEPCQANLCLQRFVMSERIAFDQETLIFLCDYLNPVTEECENPWAVPQANTKCPGSAEEVLAAVVANSDWSKEQAMERLEVINPGMFAKPKTSSTSKKTSSSTKKKESATKSSNSTVSGTTKTTSSGSFASTTVLLVTEFFKRSPQSEGDAKPTESAAKSSSSSGASSSPTKTTTSGSSKSSAKTDASKTTEEEEEAPLITNPTELPASASPLPVGETRPFNIPYDIPIRPMPPAPFQQIPSYLCYAYTVAENGETCYWTTSRTQTPIDQFLRLNPQLNMEINCRNLWADYAYCTKELADLMPVMLAPEYVPTAEEQAQIDAAKEAAKKAQEDAASGEPKKPASG